MAGTATPVRAGEAGNVWADAIIFGSRWDSPGNAPGETTTISVNIAGQGGSEPVDAEPITALEPTADELAYIRASMEGIEAVCNLNFVEVAEQGDADIVWAVVDDEDGEGALGWATLPIAGAGGDFQGTIAINRDAFGDDPDTLAVGGFDYATPIHELGHALGLDHSHDRPTPFPGVSDSGDLGDFGMNQGAYTMMGYNDGWLTAPHGRTPSSVYGFQAGPMAIDIAALQAMYGVNTATATGDDTYRLPDANELGTFYSCIWDAGGTDLMRGTGLGDTVDLRAATLREEPGGGGWVSHAEGIHGGFTVAGGVVIENASGGAGGDRIQGNAAANVVKGQGGNDYLKGSDGDDRVSGGGGQDSVIGGAGRDALTGGSGADSFVFAKAGHSAGATRDTVRDFEAGRDTLAVGAVDADEGVSGDQDFVLDAGGAFAAGEVRQTASGGDLLLVFNADGEAEAEMSILLEGVSAPLAASDFDL